MRISSTFASVALLCIACGSNDAEKATAGNTGSDGGGGACSPPLVTENGACIDPLRRFEPKEQLDQDNVVSYGDVALTMKLPDPPKSGFRLIVPPRVLQPGDEIEDCSAWAYPALTNRNVYAARVYTTGGLHHSNMYGVPLPASGASPYPACAAGQADVFSQVPNILKGDIMDVLFANSTQIQGGEQIVFPKGMAFKLKTEGREVATTIHWLNTTADTFTSEVVYDFFTMPDEDVETEIVPFVFENQGFTIPAQSEGTISMTCDLTRPANIVSIMPHTHSRATAFDVDLVRSDDTTERIFHDGTFDTKSDIEVFDTAVSTEGFAKIHHECQVTNDLSKPIVWGIGQNEMCTLFGYLYPPSSQLLGYVGKPGADGQPPACITLDIGSHRTP
ncbi:MAG TPA: hypothetical protein VHE30_06245 [Polyangiaceae bacterium]|nr:hypothetical protein [Polyangiaceae bacterium]